LALIIAEPCEVVVLPDRNEVPQLRRQSNGDVAIPFELLGC